MMDSIDDLLQGNGDVTVSITEPEAWMLDHIFTAPSWDDNVIRNLLNDLYPIRSQIGGILLGHTDSIVLSYESLDYLTVLVDPFFQMGGKPTGRDLKEKLWAARLGPRKVVDHASSTKQDAPSAEGSAESSA